MRASDRFVFGGVSDESTWREANRTGGSLLKGAEIWRRVVVVAWLCVTIVEGGDR
jgi:hypothetical protein